MTRRVPRLDSLGVAPPRTPGSLTATLLPAFFLPACSDLAQPVEPGPEGLQDTARQNAGLLPLPGRLHTTCTPDAMWSALPRPGGSDAKRT
jgi:hypothetical protein